MDRQVPRTDLSPYRLEERLGQGGMGTVYQAVDERLGRRVAVKHLPPAVAVHEARRRRFRREAATLARLSHPAIVQIFDLLEADDGDWIVMELVTGPTLAELIKDGPLPVSQVLDVGRQIAEGLGEAHDQGILHRDLKAENVMLQRPGSGRTSAATSRTKILDFGLAKILQEETESELSASGQLLGTARSMSPEQVRGLPLDARSDLFSLGLLLYEMTTGEPALRGQADLETLQRIAGHPHRPAITRRSDTPARLSALIDRLLEKSPGDRPASAHEVVEELARISAEIPQDGIEAPRSRRGLLMLVLGTSLALVLAVKAWRQAPEGVVPKPELESTLALPAEPDAHALFQQGMAWLERPDKSGHLDRAITVFQAALARDETSAAAHAGLALAYQEQYYSGRDPLSLEQALAVADQAVRLDEHLALARVALGNALTYGGRFDDALRELKLALQLEPSNARAYRGLGEAHRRRGDIEEAIDAYEHAMELAPQDRVLRDQLGRLYYRSARYDDAEAQILHSIQLAPDRAEGYRDLSAVYYMQGRLSEAAEAVQKALAIQPEHSLYSNLGTILFAQGLYPSAVRAFERALGLGGANFYLYWANLADARRMMGDGEAAKADYAQAIELLRSVLANEPESPFLRSRLALYLAKRGDHRDAHTGLAEIAGLDKIQPADHYRVAVAHEVCGERARALAALGQALAAGYSLQEVRNDPELFDLRSDPRYHRLIRTYEESPYLDGS